MTRWLLALAFVLLLSFNGWGCGVQFETPDSWEDRYAELAAEHGLPSNWPDPGQRPDRFSCAVPSPVGCMLVQSTDPASVSFYVLGSDGWIGPSVLRTPANGVVSVDLSDGTDVWVVGNLLIFDGAYTELDTCDAPLEPPTEKTVCF